MKKGQELYNRAKSISPGGTMLLSKRPEMFLPNGWPCYFKSTKGICITDLEDNLYRDMTIMGIGTNTLGYSNNNVDEAVRGVVDKGNMSTLNCPEEVMLAEKLIELNPWAEMVRFARSGGEANSIAIRIARAAVGKSKVAICGYHGWHDWYLSTNHNSQKQDELKNHLLPGLSIDGVPKELANTVFGFKYNDIESFKNLIETEDIGVVKMEVMRNYEPENNFLKEIRAITKKKNIILIFDECTSGFRETYGGLHKKYNIQPDMAMFGKTLGNGYAITAVVGKKEIMSAAQTTFISSTFWTERIGPTAGLASLKEMKLTKSWEYISELGKTMKLGWRKLAEKNNIKIDIFGIDALATYSFVSENAMIYKTLVAEKMLKKGFLASTNFYPSTAHKQKDVDDYLDELDDVFLIINKIENNEISVKETLESPVCHDGFRRLN
jgi:glutamate-1-semialdehyde 2,1-aminomutase